MPKRVVIDTNAYVSYLLSKNPDSAVVRAVEMAHDRHVLLQSPDTLAELEEVLGRPKFQKAFSPDDVRALLDDIKNNSKLVVPRETMDVSPDPKDNKFFELARAAQADVIISGDKKHVVAIQIEGTRSMQPYTFIDPAEVALIFSHEASHIRRTKRLEEPKPEAEMA